MRQIKVEELKTRQIFTFKDIKCIAIGCITNTFYIITAIPSEMGSKRHVVQTSFWEGPHPESRVQVVIDTELPMFKTGYYFGISKESIVLTDDEILEELPHDKNYLFPSIESL